MTAGKLMFGLIIIPIRTHIVSVIAFNLHADSEARCIAYKDVLPNGVCINELRNYNIFQSPLQARKTNQDTQLFKLFLSFVEKKTPQQGLMYWDRALHAFFSRFPRCYSNPKLRKVLQDARKELAKNISFRCINSVIRVFCYFVHPVCFKSEEDSRIILSPLCRRMCTESACNSFMKTWLYNLASNTHKLCPNDIEDPRKDEDVYSCARFPTADMKHIERCQNIVETKEKHFTGTCYDDDDGTFYNGNVNISSTGKTCQPWNINPFLSSPVYSNLRNNYCRNPQGYATAPWCYVNATNREWEFCDVPKCVRSNKANNENVTSIEMIVIIVVSGLVFTFLLVVSSWKIYCVCKNQLDSEEYIDPYYVSDASSEEKKSQLLKLLIENEH